MKKSVMINKPILYISECVLKQCTGIVGMQLRVNGGEKKSVYSHGDAVVKRNLLLEVGKLKALRAQNVADLCKCVLKNTDVSHKQWKEHWVGWELYNPLTRKVVDGSTKLKNVQQNNRWPLKMNKTDLAIITELKDNFESDDFQPEGMRHCHKFVALALEIAESGETLKEEDIDEWCEILASAKRRIVSTSVKASRRLIKMNRDKD
jgi:hypothetical protein